MMVNIKSNYNAVIAIATGIAAIAVIALGFMIIKTITIPVAQVQNALVGFSHGNLDIPVVATKVTMNWE